jgi:hypothetical protein
MRDYRRTLRATKVDVYGVALVFYHFCRFKQSIWVVSTKLNNQRPILGACRKVYVAIVLCITPTIRVEHLSENEVGAISTEIQCRTD